MPATEPVLHLRYDEPVAVIGDIHGCAVQLRALLARLPKTMPVLVVGDLCDRGPDTRDVLDLLVARGARGVLGNHDEWILGWARGEGFDTAALSPMMAGEATLRSYGVEGRTPSEIEEQRWRVPAQHVAFLEGLATVIDFEVMGEKFWLTHAGVPTTESLAGLRIEEVVPHLARTKPAVLRWPSTDPDSMMPLDRPVIMGHVPQRRPLNTRDVLAIDRGAGTCAPWRLTAVTLPERRFVSVDRSAVDAAVEAVRSATKAASVE
jgi:serine/threonine protein phosphatase 1